MIPTQRDAKIIRAVIARMKQGPSMNVVLSSYKLTNDERIALERQINERVREWCQLWFIAELDGLLPPEERAKNER